MKSLWTMISIGINPGITERNFEFTQPSIRLSIPVLAFQH